MGSVEEGDDSFGRLMSLTLALDDTLMPFP